MGEGKACLPAVDPKASYRSAMRRLLPLLFATLVLAGCTSDLSEPSDPSPVPSSTAQVATSSTTQPPPGIEELPVGQQEVLSDLIRITEETRGLDFIEPPSIKVVTPEELAVLVREDVEENIEDIDVDQALYRLLGLIDGDTELLDLYTGVLGEQVAGFYDSETAELVVPLRADEFGALERSTIVHELTHALTDQHFDFGAVYEAMIDEERFDEAAAYQSVIEGDAVLTELAYLRDLPVEEQREVIQESLAVESTALDAAPRFFRESLIFPYVQGQVFMDRLFQLEGRAGIDQAYANPPVSTEQIITPEDYRRDEPVEVELPELAPDGYQLEYDGVWGELSFELMFNQVLGGRPDAADGWGGDGYQVYFDGNRVALVLRWVGDTSEDATEMESALLDYLDAIAGPEAEPEEGGSVVEPFGWVSRAGDRIDLVMASDPDTGAALVESLTGP